MLVVASVLTRFAGGEDVVGEAWGTTAVVDSLVIVLWKWKEGCVRVLFLRVEEEERGNAGVACRSDNLYVRKRFSGLFLNMSRAAAPLNFVGWKQTVGVCGEVGRVGRYRYPHGYG